MAHTPGPWEGLGEVAVELLKACKAQQKLIEDMMRFVGVMALKDYQLLNEAPILADRAIRKAIRWGEEYRTITSPRCMDSTDANNLLECCREAYQALADIINAASNKQPYSAKELEEGFQPIVNRIYEVLETIEGRRQCQYMT